MYRDADGYFYFCGRGDDMLKVGGIWVAPFEIDGAGGAPRGGGGGGDRRAGREDLIKPKAYCALRDLAKASPAKEHELIGFIKQRLAPFKYPRWIEFVDDLPKTASGKI